MVRPALNSDYLEQQVERPEGQKSRTHGTIEHQSRDTVAAKLLGNQPEHSKPGTDGYNQYYDGLHNSVLAVDSCASSLTQPDRSRRNFNQLIIVDE